METAFWIVMCIIICFTAGFYIKHLQNRIDFVKNTADTYKDIANNKDAVILSLKEILRANNIDLGNLLPLQTNQLENFVNKLRDIRNSDTKIPLDVYHKLCDLEKELLSFTMTLEKEVKAKL